ncbi:MAG: PorV/PorQ family protein [Candidatus Aminicenantales bacterium]
MSAVSLFLIFSTSFGGFGPSATGFTFMKIGVGARPVALGQAFTAIADDIYAIFYNPAGLALEAKYDASLTLCEMLRGVFYASGGVVAPLWKRLSFGLGGGYLNATDVRRSGAGEEVGTFGLNDLVVGPVLAWQPAKWFALGASTKFVYSRIDSFSSWAVSFDGGVLYRPMRYITLGASLLHFGTPRRFLQVWEYQPLNLRGGVSLKFPFAKHYILVGSDFSAYPDYGPTAGLGVEGKLDLNARGANKRGAVYLRGGYRSGGHLGTWSGFSFGVGYETILNPGISLLVDAVYLFYGILGDAQRVSIGLRWTSLQDRW